MVCSRVDAGARATDVVGTRSLKLVSSVTWSWDLVVGAYYCMSDFACLTYRSIDQGLWSQALLAGRDQLTLLARKTVLRPTVRILGRDGCSTGVVCIERA